jgi:hypothetical protein
MINFMRYEHAFVYMSSCSLFDVLRLIISRRGSYEVCIVVVVTLSWVGIHGSHEKIMVKTYFLCNTIIVYCCMG